MHPSWVRNRDVADLISELWEKLPPNAHISHVFGSYAARDVTLAQVREVLFESESLSQDLMAVLFDRLCSQHRFVHFVHPGVWDRADLVLKRGRVQGNTATDASGFVSPFPLGTQVVLFPFVVGDAWAVCVFLRDTPTILISCPSTMRLVSHTIPFLKGVMNVFLKSRATLPVRCSSFHGHPHDSGFIVHDVCSWVLRTGNRDLSLCKRTGEAARNFCASQLAGLSYQRK